MSYTRFVIVSHLRSGTHLLRTLLESHPAIVCQSEVFNSDNPNLPYPLTASTDVILSDWVFRDFPPSVQCAGFVLQAYHPGGLRAFPGIRENPTWNDIWPRLQVMSGVKVIHLRRENGLRRHLSHIMARRSGDWHDWDEQRVASVSHLETPRLKTPERTSRAPVSLDADRLKTDFEEVERLHQRVRKQFGKHPYFPLSYEALCAEPERRGRQLLDFLGVSPAPLEAAVSKLEHRSLADSIENFEQLRRVFQGTPWQGYFEETEA